MGKKFLIILVVVVGLALVLYTYMGGFATVTVTKTVSTPLLVAGKYFEGSTNAEELVQLYQQVGQVVEQKKLAGDFAGIFYNNPDQSSQTIKAFIGVAIKDSTVALPPGYTVRAVPAGRQVLRGELDAHITVAPKRIYSALFDYAKERSLTLEAFYVERFPEGQPAVVEVALAR